MPLGVNPKRENNNRTTIRESWKKETKGMTIEERTGR